MVELGVRIKTEPLDMDENNNKSNNSGNHLQNHNSVSNSHNSKGSSNLGATSLCNSSNFKESIVNSRCCSNLDCSKSQKENCPQGVYERKQTAIKHLLKAVQSNDFEHLKRLLESKPDLNVLLNGQTILHYCLLMGRDVNWAKQLVKSGANPNLSNLDGWHPIHLAAFNGLQETLRYLITVKHQYHY